MDILNVMDIVLTCCFVFEMTVKLITLGVAFGDNAYLKVRMLARFAV